MVTIIIIGHKYYFGNGKRLNNILSGLFAFVSLVIWQKHCKYVFPSAATSKHAMTVENYQSVFGDKSVEDIRAICNGLFNLSVTFKDVWVLLAIAVLLGIFIFFFSRENMRDYKKLLVFSIVFYACYLFGMLGMYLFSMPGVEATTLAGSKRYLKTILIAIFLLYMAFSIRVISLDKNKQKENLIFSIAVIVSIFVFSYISQGSIQFAPRTVNNSEERLWIESNKELYSMPMHESYCMLIPSSDSGYAYFLLRYVFQSTDVSSKTVESIDDLSEVSSKYILVYDKDNEIINAWINATYPEQIGNDVIIQ